MQEHVDNKYYLQKTSMFAEYLTELIGLIMDIIIQAYTSMHMVIYFAELHSQTHYIDILLQTSMLLP